MRLLAICGASLGAVVFGFTAGARTRPPAPVQPSTQAPVLSPVVPRDLSANASQADAAAFAWQSFVAVNWPALAGARGVADTTKTIGQPGVAVWGTWKTPEEIFLPGGQAPGPWSQGGAPVPAVCRAAGATTGAFVVQRLAKVAGAASPELATVRPLVAGTKDHQVLGGTLTDQHGNLARYEVRVNQIIFDAIVANRYYSRARQDSVGMITLPPNVMEVKAAWREMTPADSLVATRYLRRDAWIYTPGADSTSGTCVPGELGLVGLHVTQKLPSLGGWAWATFEQVDNVPPFGSTGPVPGRTLPYSFNNPACPATTCVPNQSTESPPGHPTTTPTQVTRRVDVDTVAQRVNPAWQQALAAVPGSPFPFYQLIGVQWQRSPNGPVMPNTLANTALETYVEESSCRNCHYVAKTASGRSSSDYSFILAEAQSPVPAASARRRPSQRVRKAVPR